MKRTERIFLNLLGYLISTCVALSLRPILFWFVEIQNQAPECCDDKVEFTGSHTSLFGEELFYQCPKCKKVFTIPNSHKGMKFGEFWKLLFLNNIESKG